jgi:exonuclease VII large subunit
VTAIGHANDHTILDDIADFSLAVPSMVGKWLAEQLEMIAPRQADSKRLSGLKFEEELKKLQGEMVAVGKARVEEQKALLQLQTDWGALVERMNNLSQNRSLWRTGARVAWVFIGGWIAGKMLGWW